jgi:hypothetical protein
VPAKSFIRGGGVMIEEQFDQACDAARSRFWAVYENAPDETWRDDTDRAYAALHAEFAALTDRRMRTLAGMRP